MRVYIDISYIDNEKKNGLKDEWMKVRMRCVKRCRFIQNICLTFVWSFILN